MMAWTFSVGFKENAGGAPEILHFLHDAPYTRTFRPQIACNIIYIVHGTPFISILL